MRQPISPALHGLIDYGFGLAYTTLPSLLGLTGPGRAIPADWGIGQGALNALTDQPYAVSRKVSFRTHGLMEAGGVPTLVGVTVASGAMKDPKARRFFIGMFAALATVYTLTDYKEIPKK
jgi:hypothetical protein